MKNSEIIQKTIEILESFAKGENEYKYMPIALDLQKFKGLVLNYERLEAKSAFKEEGIRLLEERGIYERC